MSTVNISHLGTEAEVQLAEALVAVSEAVVAAAAEGDDTSRVVAVEETTHSEDDAVMQQVGVLVLNIRCRVHGNSSFCLVIQFLLFSLGECRYEPTRASLSWQDCENLIRVEDRSWQFLFVRETEKFWICFTSCNNSSIETQIL